MKNRLDHELVNRQMVNSRSQAESYVRMGAVKVNGKVVTKPGYFVDSIAKVELNSDQYVSRAGLKLASVAKVLNLDFKNKTVLDVGSSTGGFTDFALKHGAKKVIAVDVGTDQLHPSLRTNPKVELYEKTDVRDVVAQGRGQGAKSKVEIEKPDIVVIDVSFISLREILPSVSNLANSQTRILAMVKPQFEAGKAQTSRGVIKNDRVRRQILKDFEAWAKNHFITIVKADSDLAGEKGNLERFYLLQKL